MNGLRAAAESGTLMDGHTDIGMDIVCNLIELTYY